MQGSSFEEVASESLIAWAEASGHRDKIEDALGRAGRAFDDSVLQPIKEQTKEAQLLLLLYLTWVRLKVSKLLKIQPEI